METSDKDSIADLVATHGSSSATAWLEFERYKLWRPTEPVPESSFVPVQGYMERAPYIFAWGNPLVSDPDALPGVARQFVDFCAAQNRRVVWACVDRDLEEILAGAEFGWSAVSCIYEDVVDPAHVIELTSPEAKGKGGQHVVKDLKKNLGRAEKYDVRVSEMKAEEWSREDMLAVEDGIKEWRERKRGIQIASTTMQPWLDSSHRRYWLARQAGKPVGILILTPIQACAWQIKNAISFPSAPKGTSEVLIYTALKDLHAEEEKAEASGKLIPHPSHGNCQSTPIQPPAKEQSSPDAMSESESENGTLDISEPSNDDTTMNGNGDQETLERNTPAPNYNQRDSDPGASKTHHRDDKRVTVTFGISAAPEFHPIRNVGGWKVKALSKTYKKVAFGAKLIQRGEFRSKFDSEADPMYVCYPANGFGFDGVNALLKVLRK